MDERGFSGAWETLVRTGLDPAWSGNSTLTPSHYVPAADDDLALPEPAPLDPAVLDRLPRLELGGEDADLMLRGELGRGGMAVVRGARQQSLARDVAVKRLHDMRPAHVDALLREARLLGGLAHPNIVAVHALGLDETGAPVLVMKQVRGKRWSDLIHSAAEPGRLGLSVLERHLEILRDVCRALQFAHSRGVVHRDVKPGNVLVGEFGEVVLVDWGIAARLGEAAVGMALGTPAYMAPEMVTGSPADPRNDVYLVGSTLHRVLTGRPRHTGSNVEQVLYAAHRSEPVEYGEEVPVELAAIARRATEAEPGARFQSIEDLVAALDEFEEHRTSRQLTQSADLRARAFAERSADAHDPELLELGRQVRFGYQQALEAWERNEGARLGLLHHLERQIPLALGRDDAAEANAMWADFIRWGGVHEKLGDRVAKSVRRQEALTKLGKELDLSVRAGWRLAYLGFYTGSAFLFGGLAVASVRFDLVPLDYRIGLYSSAASAMVLSVLVLVGRKALLGTLANQRVTFTVVVVAWGVALHRLVALGVGASLQATLVFDMVLLAMAAAVASVTLNTRLFAVVAILIGLIGGAVLVPSVAFELATLSLGCAGMTLMLVYAPWVRAK